MSGKKTIQINPDFFRINKRSKKREKKKKQERNATLKPNNIKRQLLQKIKAHQQTQQNLEVQRKKEEGETKKFQSDFKTSLNYLQRMIGEKKNKNRRKQRDRKHTVRNYNNPNIPTGNISISTPRTAFEPRKSSLVKEPRWGCLKNGNKPTWRQYQQTLKKKTEEKINVPKFPEATPAILERQSKLSTIKDNLRKAAISLTPKTESITTNRTLKIYKLGRRGNRVGVLIKSGKTIIKL